MINIFIIYPGFLEAYSWQLLLLNINFYTLERGHII